MGALGKNLACFSHIYNRHYRKEILSLPVVQLPEAEENTFRPPEATQPLSK